MACTASVKTVVANPIVHLTNLTHDILQTINTLNSPPQPDFVNNEVRRGGEGRGRCFFFLSSFWDFNLASHNNSKIYLSH